MGRNKFGGNKQRGMANKDAVGLEGEPMRYVADPRLEFYAKVVRALGNGMFHVKDSLQRLLVAHVRGKMRGKSKRSNLIKLDDIVLIGLREWESSPKNCDILFLYDPSHLPLLPPLLFNEPSDPIAFPSLFSYTDTTSSSSSSSNNQSSSSSSSSESSSSESYNIDLI